LLFSVLICMKFWGLKKKDRLLGGLLDFCVGLCSVAA